MSDIESDEERDGFSFNPGEVPNIKPGMFVSGWDDPDNDIGIEKDENPTASLERELLWAASEDHLEIAAGILEKDPSSINAQDRDGYTPLHQTCYNNNYELAKIFLSYGADINARTELGWTPLHSACQWNYDKLAALMLQHNTDVNARSQGDQTPLHIASTVSACRNNLVTLLMNPKCDASITNNSNETAYQLAKRNGLCAPLFDMANPALSVETGIIE